MMAKLDTYRKRAKQLQRWYAQGTPSLGGLVRLVDRYRELSDAAVLAMLMPLAMAQAVVAAEAGHDGWAALKAATDGAAEPNAPPAGPTLAVAIPVLCVRDVAAAATFYRDRLGFAVEFLHGEPPFYGSVVRDAARLHLRFVRNPTFAELAAREASLIAALVEVTGAKALFAAFEAQGVAMAQPLVRQPWGGLDFQVCDPDNNRIGFVEYRRAAAR